MGDLGTKLFFSTLALHLVGSWAPSCCFYPFALTSGSRGRWPDFHLVTCVGIDLLLLRSESSTNHS